VLQGMAGRGSKVKMMQGTRGTLPGEVAAREAVKTSHGGGFFVVNSGGGEWLLRCTSDQGEGCDGFSGFQWSSSSKWWSLGGFEVAWRRQRLAKGGELVWVL
jgi:hypothetical protein